MGWAQCTVSDKASSCTITASYLSDALRNLLIAANAVLSGFREVTFRFDEEPGEYRWVIESPRLNEIELRILSFPQLWGDNPDAEGKELFRTRCLPEQFSEAVHEAAAALLAKLGEEQYAAQWCEYPFPKLQFQELEGLIAEAKRDT